MLVVDNLHIMNMSNSSENLFLKETMPSYSHSSICLVGKSILKECTSLLLKLSGDSADCLLYQICSGSGDTGVLIRQSLLSEAISKQVDVSERGSECHFLSTLPDDAGGVLSGHPFLQEAEAICKAGKALIVAVTRELSTSVMLTLKSRTSPAAILFGHCNGVINGRLNGPSSHSGPIYSNIDAILAAGSILICALPLGLSTDLIAALKARDSPAAAVLARINERPYIVTTSPSHPRPLARFAVSESPSRASRLPMPPVKSRDVAPGRGPTAAPRSRLTRFSSLRGAMRHHPLPGSASSGHRCAGGASETALGPKLVELSPEALCPTASVGSEALATTTAHLDCLAASPSPPPLSEMCLAGDEKEAVRWEARSALSDCGVRAQDCVADPCSGAEGGCKFELKQDVAQGCTPEGVSDGGQARQGSKVTENENRNVDTSQSRSAGNDEEINYDPTVPGILCGRLSVGQEGSQPYLTSEYAAPRVAEAGQEGSQQPLTSEYVMLLNYVADSDKSWHSGKPTGPGLELEADSLKDLGYHTYPGSTPEMVLADSFKLSTTIRDSAVLGMEPEAYSKAATSSELLASPAPAKHTAAFTALYQGSDVALDSNLAAGLEQQNCHDDTNAESEMDIKSSSVRCPVDRLISGSAPLLRDLDRIMNLPGRSMVEIPQQQQTPVPFDCSDGSGGLANLKALTDDIQTCSSHVQRSLNLMDLSETSNLDRAVTESPTNLQSDVNILCEDRLDVSGIRDIDVQLKEFTGLKGDDTGLSQNLQSNIGNITKSCSLIDFYDHDHHPDEGIYDLNYFCNMEGEYSYSRLEMSSIATSLTGKSQIQAHSKRIGSCELRRSFEYFCSKDAVLSISYESYIDLMYFLGILPSIAPLHIAREIFFYILETRQKSLESVSFPFEPRLQWNEFKCCLCFISQKCKDFSAITGISENTLLLSDTDIEETELTKFHFSDYVGKHLEIIDMFIKRFASKRCYDKLFQRSPLHYQRKKKSACITLDCLQGYLSDLKISPSLISVHEVDDFSTDLCMNEAYELSFKDFVSLMQKVCVRASGGPTAAYHSAVTALNSPRQPGFVSKLRHDLKTPILTVSRAITANVTDFCKAKQLNDHKLYSQSLRKPPRVTNVTLPFPVRGLQRPPWKPTCKSRDASSCWQTTPLSTPLFCFPVSFLSPSSTTRRSSPRFATSTFSPADFMQISSPQTLTEPSISRLSSEVMISDLQVMISDLEHHHKDNFINTEIIVNNGICSVKEKAEALPTRVSAISNGPGAPEANAANFETNSSILNSLEFSSSERKSLTTCKNDNKMSACVFSKTDCTNSAAKIKRSIQDESLHDIAQSEYLRIRNAGRTAQKRLASRYNNMHLVSERGSWYLSSQQFNVMNSAGAESQILRDIELRRDQVGETMIRSSKVKAAACSDKAW